MLNFKNMQEVEKWIEDQSKKYGSKNKFFASDEYKKAYQEIKKIHEQEKKKYKEQKIKDKTVSVSTDGKRFGLKLVNQKGYITPIGPFGMGGGEFPFKTEKEAREYAKKYKFTVKGNFMKNELKTLYKKDPVLAQKAAKALGYKIVSGLERFQGKEYKDYKFGNPAEASKKLQKAIEVFIKTAMPALKEAGGFLAPGMVKSLQEDIRKAIESEVKKIKF